MNIKTRGIKKNIYKPNDDDETTETAYICHTCIQPCQK